jgi:hypothetical protein
LLQTNVDFESLSEAVDAGYAQETMLDGHTPDGAPCATQDKSDSVRLSSAVHEWWSEN